MPCTIFKVGIARAGGRVPGVLDTSRVNGTAVVVVVVVVAVVVAIVLVVFVVVCRRRSRNIPNRRRRGGRLEYFDRLLRNPNS